MIFVLSISHSFAQTKTLILPRPVPSSAPGNIKLLSGYIHERKKGIDTAVGIISKKNGLEIRYDIGLLAGNITENKIADNKNEAVWYKRQLVNNDYLSIAYFKDGQITASYYEASAIFFARVSSQEEIIDFLLMIMTYGSKDEPKNNKTIKQN